MTIIHYPLVPSGANYFPTEVQTDERTGRTSHRSRVQADEPVPAEHPAAAKYAQASATTATADTPTVAAEPPQWKWCQWRATRVPNQADFSTPIVCRLGRLSLALKSGHGCSTNYSLAFYDDSYTTILPATTELIKTTDLSLQATGQECRRTLYSPAGTACPAPAKTSHC